MDRAEDKNPRRKLRLALLFAMCIFVLVFIASQVARYHPPSNAVLVIAGAAGLMINAMNWFFYSRIASAQGWRMAWLKVSRFAVMAACAGAIAYGYGESRLSQYALWIFCASFVVSLLLRVFRGQDKAAGTGMENKKVY